MAESYTTENEKVNPRPPVWFVYLDIEGDPVRAWTATWNMTFGASETGDPLLDGFEFLATGGLGEIGNIADGLTGGGPVTLRLPAVDPAETAFNEIVANARSWQWRRAVIWRSYIDLETGQLLYPPRRVRSGRMDNLKAVDAEDDAYISVDVESHAAHAQVALESRYAEQREIDATDISQKWVHDLANKQVTVGGTSGSLNGAGPGERPGDRGPNINLE